MATFGFIGAGEIGSQIASRALEQGHSVIISNSRGPETLERLIREFGSSAKAATAEQAAEYAEVLVVATPLSALAELSAFPPELYRGKTVIDANNYWPPRDRRIAEIEDGSTTVSELLQKTLPGAHVVKAFNHILAAHITAHAITNRSSIRRALALAGNSPAARDAVSRFITGAGFEPVDAGELSQGRRFEPGQPSYGVTLAKDGMIRALRAAR
jgi:8-hydroxy-5-deazaflavin:NADPH oxidoreductase